MATRKSSSTGTKASKPEAKRSSPRRTSSRGAAESFAAEERAAMRAAPELARYATLGFSDKAALDDGDMWPTSFALKALTSAEENCITELVGRAAG